ncbi:hypothetical protein PanWU01x14_025030 [Parasponia andersonii]|uniref:Uncharacterized protein n=1 Tax=Parasponia andersonii TaxID=3476 RepID=A0A2P5DWS1_PARAD|nr:hypothetical protein PanWU01x14_025030 [Parasponia andersonii]
MAVDIGGVVTPFLESGVQEVRMIETEGRKDKNAVECKKRKGSRLKQKARAKYRPANRIRQSKPPQSDRDNYPWEMDQGDGSPPCALLSSHNPDILVLSETMELSWSLDCAAILLNAAGFNVIGFKPYQFEAMWTKDVKSHWVVKRAWLSTGPPRSQ